VGILQSIQNIFSTPQKKEQRSINYSLPYGPATQVSPTTALTFSAVWAAMRLLSESISTLPVGVFRRENNGDNVEVNSDLSFLIKYQPNTYQNKITFYEKIIMDMLSDGNSYVQIVRNRNGRVLELLPLNYGDVTTYTLDNKLYYSNEDSGETIDSENILHFKMITGPDGITGLSPIEQCKNAIGWGMDVQEYSSTFFKNGGKLSGILESDRALSEQAIDRLRNSFNKNYGTLNGSNQTAVLEEGLKYKSISVTPDQAQFLASRQFSIQEVARIFGLPPHLLKDLSASSFNNIEMQSQEFVSYSLMPYISKIELEMSLKLFRRNNIGREYIKFNVNGLLRGNVKDRADYYKTAITNGWMTVNEVREKEDLNKVDDGDSNYIQMNMTTINEIGETEDVYTNTDGNIDVTEIPPATSEAQDALRGSVGGVNGILAIQEKVSSGITGYDSAIQILRIIFGFSEDEAKAILGEPIQEFDDSNKKVDE
jgi:HK97 family phage portal protein